MVKRILSKEQIELYGRFVVEPSDKQLSEYFFLGEKDLSLIRQLRTDTNKLGFAVQLGTIRFLGLFLSEPTDVPQRVVDYVAKQLEVEPKLFKNYRKEIRQSSLSNHVQLIKEQYNYFDFSSPETISHLEHWLERRLLSTNERPSLTFDWLVSKCVNENIILPGISTIERLVIRMREQIEQLILDKISCIPNKSEMGRFIKNIKKDKRKR